MNPSTAALRRYTSLPALLYLLRRRALTLVPPASWEDRNDSRYLELYRERKSLGAVRALCFTETGETFHHWRVFTEPVSGVCVQFSRATLLRAVAREPGLRHGRVRYVRLSDARTRPPALEALPFVKRWAFQDEREYRLIWHGADPHVGAHDVAIPLHAIRSVTLAPGMHASLAREVKDTLRCVPGCARLPVVHSKLLESAEWVRLGSRAAPP